MNEYPSTHDVLNRMAPIAGAQDDPVLTTMEAALERLGGKWTAGDYIRDRGGEVCAMGALLVADGKEDNYFDRSGIVDFYTWFERTISDTAKEAIAELDAVARELYPHSDIPYRDPRDLTSSTYYGPLEWVNQVMGEEDVVQVYKTAIERRRGALVH